MSRKVFCGFAACALSFSILLQAQTTERMSQVRRARLEKQGRDLLEDVLKRTDQLALPQNRITIEPAAVELLWKSDPQRARALVRAIGQEMEQLANLNEPDDLRRQNRQQFIMMQRQQLVQNVAQQDP